MLGNDLLPTWFHEHHAMWDLHGLLGIWADVGSPANHFPAALQPSLFIFYYLHGPVEALQASMTNCVFFRSSLESVAAAASLLAISFL